MSDSVTLEANAPATAAAVEHFDVLVIGAGISGIGAAWHLTKQMPGSSFAVLEVQGGYGGTWRSHNFPGIRSDSDLYTFGYHFKPWVGPPIAAAAEIQRYLGEVIDENDLGRHIRYGHRILSADWSATNARWTLRAERTDTGETLHFSCGFLWMCQGYFRHRDGFMPKWPGMADFKGTIAHCEEWPADLQYAGKRVVVIGSGATAATVIPAMAQTAAHVTMLQRSPTYFLPSPNENEFANTLRKLQVDDALVHELTRRKNNFDMTEITRRSFEEPEVLRAELLEAVRTLLPPDFDMQHFTPSYRPWRQRIAMVPDGDMFQAINAGKASVVTDEIDRFTTTGIQLKSGAHLEADIIAAATGFNLCVMGDIAFSVDGAPVDFSQTVTYRGMLFTGVPNLVWVFGYFRNSWTLRADLVAEYVCRLLAHMQEKGARAVTPALRPEDHNMPLGPWLASENMNSGYLQRGMHLLPQAGDKDEWRHSQDYWREKDEFPKYNLDDAALRYS
jgi:cation diffusion facilitator CzcD-associated flavoprotein CzcO